MSEKKLLINLSSGDTKLGTSALRVAEAAQYKGMQVTLFLNAEAVRFLDTSMLQQISCVSGVTVQDMISSFIRKGGNVIVAHDAIKQANVNTTEFINGVAVLDNYDPLLETVFDDSVRILSW